MMESRHWRRLVAAAAVVCCSSAVAFGVGTPATYSRLVWQSAIVAPGFAGCTQLVFDATGDLANSNTLVLAGALNCGAGGYGMTGSLYMATDGSLNITMIVGGYTVSCPRVSGWVGLCSAYDASGVLRGSGLISLL